MKARYVRTSTLNQNEARQLAKLHPDEILFIDKVSGTISFDKREQAKHLMEQVEAGKIT